MIDKLEILEDFMAAFPLAGTPLIVRSPGRVNIIGEHTDYNEGFVLPAAIDKAAYVAISLRDDDEVHLFARDLGERYTVRLPDIASQKETEWANYLLGPVAQFMKMDVRVSGFNCMLTSDVPIGAGLSSSAAVECAVTFAMNELLGIGLDRITMVKMAQKAEHEYAGVMCGIMDQFASTMGKKDHVVKLDCRTLEYEYVPFRLEGIRILLLNTNVRHSLASSEYNVRRQECRQAVSWIREHLPQVNSLRDVTEEMLDRHVLPKDPLIDRRARFVVQEISRLLQGCEDLQQGRLGELGRKMFATHDGLSKMYGVSCRELDFLVSFVRNESPVIGARMMGGGFGGCTINLINENEIDNLVKRLTPAYEKEMGLPLTYYVASIENGTELMIKEEVSHV